MKLDTDIVTGEMRMILSEEELKMGFMAQCVEKLAEKEGDDYLSIFERLEKNNMTEGYILKHYNVLHTESIENIIETLSRLLHQRENQIS